MSTSLAVWLRQQPRGTAAALARKTGLDYGTIDRAKRGLAVFPHTAELISRATRGAVRERDIPQVKVGKKRQRGADGDDDDPRAAVA